MSGDWGADVLALADELENEKSGREPDAQIGPVRAYRLGQEDAYAIAAERLRRLVARRDEQGQT